MLYNNDALSLALETSMCGRGQPVDSNFKPQIPEPPEFRPTKSYASAEPGGTCDAYQFQELVEKHLSLDHAVFTFLKELKDRGFLDDLKVK